MKLTELETLLNVTFPKAFHKIYETGAMKWLELASAELKERRQEYINDSKAFLMLYANCEPYLFEEIPQAIEKLKEWISWQENDCKVKLSQNVTLIPFGHNGGGDMYCFLYTGDGEPSVILYYHDEYGDPQIAGHDFDEFMYIQMLEAALNYSEDDDEEEKTDCENFQNHLNYLNDEYRRQIEGKDIDELVDYLDGMIFDTAKIWE